MGRILLAGLVVAALAACNDMPTASNDASALTPSMDRKDNPSNDPERCASESCAWISRDLGCHITLEPVGWPPDPDVADVQVFSYDHNIDVNTPGGTETLQCKFDLNTDGARVFWVLGGYDVVYPASSVVSPPKKAVKWENFPCRTEHHLYTTNTQAVYTPAGKVHLRCQFPYSIVP
jgi:hypothetical protein